MKRAALQYQAPTPRTDHRQIITAHDLHQPGRADIFPDLHDLPRVAGWGLYNLHDLGRIPLGWICPASKKILHRIS